jgi:hypothetical protein
MTSSPETSYAFSYSIGTTPFLFDVLAGSQEEAERKVAAMATAKCLGTIEPIVS